jgi:TolB protein
VVGIIVDYLKSLAKEAEGMSVTLRRRAMILGALLAIALGALPVSSSATSPGRNGRIAVSGHGVIWTMLPDGSDVRQLTDAGFCPSYSASGQLIVFGSERSGDREVWVMRADGSEPRQVTDFGKNVDCSDISSSRPHVTVAVWGRHWGTADIHTSRLDGSEVRHLTRTPDWVDEDPAYSPNGEWIAWSRGSSDGAEQQILIMRADGTNKRRITPDKIYAYEPDWSPGGGRLLFRTNRGLATIRTDGTHVVRLPMEGDSPVWAPTGQSIAVAEDGGRCCDSVNVLALDGTHLPVENSIPANYIDSISWQPLPL